MLTGNRGKNWNRGKPIGWVTGEPGKSIQPGSRENRSNRGAREMAATGEMAHAPVKRRAEILAFGQDLFKKPSSLRAASLRDARGLSRNARGLV